MEVFVHHVYEYEKGLRNLVLHTTSSEYTHSILTKLSKRKIAYKIYDIGKGKINIFFGSRECVEVIERIGKDNLQEYTPEEDFILGIMLGYDRRRQCERYLNLKNSFSKTA